MVTLRVFSIPNMLSVFRFPSYRALGIGLPEKCEEHF